MTKSALHQKLVDIESEKVKRWHLFSEPKFAFALYPEIFYHNDYRAITVLPLCFQGAIQQTEVLPG